MKDAHPAARKNRIEIFLSKYPEYRKSLTLALAHEENSGPGGYLGWQWHDIQTHPTKIIRLVTEGIVTVNARSRGASVYILRDRQAVKEALADHHDPTGQH